MNNLETLSTMSKRNMDIKMVSNSNIISVETGKKYPTIKIAIDNESVPKIISDDYIVALYLADRKEFTEISKEDYTGK